MQDIPCLFGKLFLCKNEISLPVCEISKWYKKTRNSKSTTPRRKLEIEVAIISTVAMVIGVLGNAAVLIISYKDRRSLPRSKILITQLAVIDQVFSIINFVETVSLYWSSRWILGVALCKIVSASMLMSSLLPIGYILIIAVERFFGIIYSVRRDLNGGRLIYSCVIINFILALGTVIPILFVMEVGKYGTCNATWPAGTKYTIPYQWFLMTFYVIMPVCIVSMIYIRIIAFLLDQAKHNVALSREDIKKRRDEENRRAMKILISILIGFIVCVLPTRAIQLYHAHKYDFNQNLTKHFALLMNITYPLHSCINPIVYTAVDPKWRREVLIMLHLRKRRTARNEF